MYKLILSYENQMIEGEGMSKRGEPIAMALPYKSFKQKIALTNKYLGKYRIEDLGGILYMERRGN